ncbi:MAG: class II aldolase/adducin family protein [Proteobacteria bacterium]|jgi:L-fuculose-phosphate aldolase|nr:class II aldolase/adducin family protein [Pseudomonadota bacterium]MDA1298659.1 class II aldolase/adducin family protein [Pseudomonadota bacterium]
MPDNEASLREQLAEQYKHVERIGLNELSSGNLSCRFGDKMLISPSGATADTIEPDAIVAVSLDGEWSGDRKPSSEWRMHAAIYLAHEKAQAVVHTHSDYCVALACQQLPLPGFHYLVGSFGGNDVPCVPYSTFGTQQLGDDASAALKGRSACLLGNHGMICRGSNLKSAVDLAHRLEIMCRQYVLTRQLGEPKLLTDDDWTDFFERARKVSYGKYI